MDGEDTSRTVSRVNLPKIPSVYLSLMSFTFFLTSSPRFVTRFTPLTRRKEKWRSGESVTQDRGDGGRR